MKQSKTELLAEVFNIPSIVCGLVYGLSMFAAGFFMGVFRTFVVAPLLGDEVEAVLIEVPIMFFICWKLSKQALMVWHILNTCAGLFWDSYHSHVDTISTVSFLTLISMELMLSMTVFRRTFDETRADYASLKGSIGLAAQLVACTFPVIQELSLERGMQV
jgi:hypothetical protein